MELGYEAKADRIKDLVELNKEGEVLVNKYCETSHPGIFAAGDVTDVPYKRVVISAGQGAIAALSAYNYISKIRGKPAIKTDWKSPQKELGEIIVRGVGFEPTKAYATGS